MLPAFPAPGANIYRSNFSLAANVRTTTVLLRDFKTLLNSLQDHSTRLIEDNMAILELLLNASFSHAFFFQTRILLKSQLAYGWEPLPHQIPLPQEKAILTAILGGHKLYLKCIQHECEFFTRSSGDFVIQRHTFAVLKAMQLQAKLASFSKYEDKSDNVGDMYDLITELQNLKAFYDDPYGAVESPFIITEAKIRTKYSKFTKISRSFTEVKENLEVSAKKTDDLRRQGANFLSVYHSQNSTASLSQDALGTAVKQYKEAKSVRLYKEELASIEFYRHLPLFSRGSLVSVAHKLNSGLCYCLHNTFRLVQMGDYRYGHRYAQLINSKHKDIFSDFQRIFSLHDSLTKKSIGSYSITKLLIFGLLMARKYDTARKEIISLMEELGNITDVIVNRWLYACNDQLIHISVSDALRRHINMLSNGDSHLPLLRILGMMYYFITTYTSTTVNPLELYNDLRVPDRYICHTEGRGGDNLKTLLLATNNKIIMEVIIQSIQWIFHRLAIALAGSGNATCSTLFLVQNILLLFNLLIIPLDFLLFVTEDKYKTNLRKVLCTIGPHLDAVMDLILEGENGILFILKSSGYAAFVTIIRLVAIATNEQYYNNLHTNLLNLFSNSRLPKATCRLIEKYTSISI